jgi:UDP-3-O-[3-hydroxymyristoyl] glucosamine N-acyltransferase
MTFKDVVDFLKGEIIEIVGLLPDGYELHFADADHIDDHTLDWNATENILFISAPLHGNATLRVKDAKLAIALLGNEFLVKLPTGIHPMAIVEDGAAIGRDCYIGPYTVVKSCVTLGNYVRIESGAVIGNEGFGFVRDAQGDLVRFPQLGKVIIGDQVEIGSGTTIDRGALSDTVIGRDTKINASVHIAHNVEIGEHVVITANVNISGSVKIGPNVWIGPGTVVRDHVQIGANAYVGMGSNVVKAIPANEVWCGNPAKMLRRRS